MRNPCKFSRSISKVELEKEVTMPVSFTSLDKLMDSGTLNKSIFISDLFNLPKPRVERKNSSPRPPKKPTRPPQLAPSLFFTPEMDTPPTRSPSPYAIKYKRRGKFLVDSSPEPDFSWREKETARVETDGPEATHVNGDDSVKTSTDEVSYDDHQEPKVSISMVNLRKNLEDDYGFDSQESGSCVTTDVDEESTGGTPKVLSRQLSAAEFYDDISGEITPRMYTMRNYEGELAELRSNMAMEAQTRKKAEEAMSAMVSYWKTMREHLSEAGISLPEYHMGGPFPTKEICEQVEMARYVSKAIGRGIGRAEMEMEMGRKLKEKDLEIYRLMEQLKDYDEIKEELCRRKEEAVELTRRYKEVKKKNQWLWGSLAAGMSLGTASLARYYLGNSDVSSATATDDAS